MCHAHELRVPAITKILESDWSVLTVVIQYTQTCAHVKAHLRLTHLVGRPPSCTVNPNPMVNINCNINSYGVAILKNISMLN